MCRFYDSVPDVAGLKEFATWRTEHVSEPIIHWRNEDRANNVIVVVLTPDIDDKYVRRCEELFSTTPIVFSTGRSPFFNEPHYYNKGMSAALSRNPDWVVFTGDDMFQVDDFAKLISQLRELDSEQYDNIWVSPEPSQYHSYEAYLSSRMVVERAYRTLRRGYHGKLNEFYDKFGIQNVILPKNPIRKPIRYWLYHTMFPSILQKRLLSLKMTSDFTVLSSDFVRRQNGKVLNELFQTQADMDLSMRLISARCKSVDFKIGSVIGGHYGSGMRKAMREILDIAIFNQALRDGIYRR